MTILDAIKYLYNATDEDIELQSKSKMIPYDPHIHTWIDPDNDPPTEIPSPTGETETVITRWDLPDPQPTIQELDDYIASPEFASAHLADAMSIAIEQVKQQAETTRSKIITTTPGKIGEYTQKREEFTAWRAAGSPDPVSAGAYPIAEAEAVPYGLSVTGMLQVWEQRAAAWSQASAAIAATERGALLALEAAPDVDTVQYIVDNLSFDLPF